MLLRPIAAAAPIVALALIPALSTGTGKSARGGAPDPSVALERSKKGDYKASARGRSEDPFRLTLATRIVGRTLDGKRKVLARQTTERDGDDERLRVSARIETVADACFPFVRCELIAAASVSPLTPATAPETEPSIGEPVGRARAERRAPTGMPKMRKRRISYGSKRRKQMAAYSKRHYGEREWRLEPRGIVEHYTASSSAGAAISTFEANRADVEFGELPGVCAHYLIDTDGTILELVPTATRCRHTVGLNHETIGIEHVGNSDSDVVGRRKVLRASLALTAWLRCAYAIKRSNVIGHSESLDSPLYKELDPDFRGQTHGDMRTSTMKGYRKKLPGC